MYSFMGEELRDLVVAIRSKWDAMEQQDERSALLFQAHCPQVLTSQRLCVKVCAVVMAAGVRDWGWSWGEGERKLRV